MNSDLTPITDVVHELAGTLDPEARLATVRVAADRIEIMLIEPDSEWVAEKLGLEHGSGPVAVVIGCPDP